MKKILVPVDFSGHTEATCSYALDMAKQSGGDIMLFHTYFDQIIIADSSFPDAINMNTIYNEELLKEVFHQAERNLSGLKINLEKQISREHITNVTINTSISGGEIESELRQICSTYKPDMVVMGSTGKGNTLNVWGKVSTYIIDHAKIPVFILPETARKKGLKNIMFATDLAAETENSVRKILTLFSGNEIRLFITHFLQKEKTGDEKAAMDKLRQNFLNEEKDGILTFSLVEITDDKQTVINQFINDNNIGLVAFQPHKHGFFYLLFTRNITKKNLFAANTPLLAIPVEAKV